ncbi:hypothetical protein [Macellibacteroides fermentans]|uniref:hypothetical protein n=1 Tax=Macellibacteroides fermentans TaxID=879969 RepID=UPI00406CECF2
MKSRIEKSYPKISFVDTSWPEIYVADYTDKTGSTRTIEYHETKPADINSLKLINDGALHITAATLNEQSMTDPETGKELIHCECVLFPKQNDEGTWVLFVEIKDCKQKNMSEYFKKAKEQIIATVADFRDKEVISSGKKAHAVISFPNKTKTNYYSQFITQGDRTSFLHQYKIIIMATNTITIKNNRSLS